MSNSRIENIDEWLKTKQVSLWGHSWMITSDDSRDKAAQWFAAQMDDYLKWYQENASIVSPTVNKKRKKTV